MKRSFSLKGKKIPFFDGVTRLRLRLAVIYTCAFFQVATDIYNDLRYNANHSL